MYLGGHYTCTLKTTTSRPHTLKEWTEFSSFLSAFLALCLAKLAKLSFYYKDIAPTTNISVISSALDVRLWPAHHRVMSTSCLLQRASLYYPSSLHQMTPMKCNNIRHTNRYFFHENGISHLSWETQYESHNLLRETAENLIRMRSGSW